MKSLNIFGVIASIVLAAVSSCSKDKNDTEYYLIKSEVSGNRTVSKYSYNGVGKVSERQGFDLYSRYTYDHNNRLVKSESAINPDLYSATASTRTELMTSQNSTITSYQVFEYDQTGKLRSVKNYIKDPDGFRYTSMITFDYDGKSIVKRNLHNGDNAITQFNIYSYDDEGNVATEKYYTNLESPVPKLIRETSFKYDNKINPFKIFDELGIPGLYTNQNNITEVHTVFQDHTPGITGSNPISKTHYVYNSKGLPVRIITENSDYAYKYE